MPTSPGQWAPWITDPDPPEKPMTPEASKAAAKKAAEFMRLHKLEPPSMHAPKVPKPQ